MALDVVIAGGGFRGLCAARRLERRLPRHSARITVGSYLDEMPQAGEMSGERTAEA